MDKKKVTWVYIGDRWTQINPTNNNKCNTCRIHYQYPWNCMLFNKPLTENCDRISKCIDLELKSKTKMIKKDVLFFDVILDKLIKKDTFSERFDQYSRIDRDELAKKGVGSTRLELFMSSERHPNKRELMIIAEHYKISFDDFQQMLNVKF